MLQAISVIASILFSFLLLGAVLVILNDNQDSGRKIAWILIIGILPVIGLILYFVFGLNFRKPGFFKIRNREFLNVFDERAGEQTKELLFGNADEDRIRPRYRELSRLLSRDSGLTVSSKPLSTTFFYFLKDDGSRHTHI